MRKRDNRVNRPGGRTLPEKIVAAACSIVLAVGLMPAPAFAEADEVVLAPVYSAFEEPIPGGDITDLYAASRGQAPHVILAPSLDEGWLHLFSTARPGDILMLLGAGDIINLLPRVKNERAQRGAYRGIYARCKRVRGALWL